ncbi:hypothetical protein [Streptomyces sp. AK02-01A]|uniref:hypothetical protein n=1 Tax=Streptomyces sp. AK02-01A TaxID=3028648 RepID=UPI0029B9CB27|nr:hypothetical protein [Streptomyces sp. AK02-01A]MDX3849460.1 hypothetical protein [Streptomyces sp. AK02-01A]
MSLAAEAALIEARIRMLQEAIDKADTHIEVVSEALRHLRRPAPRPRLTAG